MPKTEGSFDYIKVNLASPHKIRSWAERTSPTGKWLGKVTNTGTLNYKNLKPEVDGLFCERIFGPLDAWQCQCGRYKGREHSGKICSKCHVEVIDSKVRRRRMGCIVLGAPVTHVWYAKSRPNKLSLILDMKIKTLELITYFNAFISLDPKEKVFPYGEVLESGDERLQEWFFKNPGLDLCNVKVGSGAEAIKELLLSLNLEDEKERSFSEIRELTPPIGPREESRLTRLYKRLRLINHFLATGSDPSWMVLDIIPVLPPELRPMFQLGNGPLVSSDLNELYKRIIGRNNRLSNLQDLTAPDMLIRNEKRMLQESVDDLISNGKRGNPVCGLNGQPLKSLSDIIKGKEGRFRQNLLGKRVDYSGRSVIVVGPELSLTHCGLPFDMAIELFLPHLIHRLIHDGIVGTIKEARAILETATPESGILAIVNKVVDCYPILLNRAPTLHCLGIQAFYPVVTACNAIRLHPLVCPAFNADFDGDQMAVHVPLCIEAQIEASGLMLGSNHVMSPGTVGMPVITPTQDMIVGAYYLTLGDGGQQTRRAQYFSSFEEVLSAYTQSVLHMQDLVWVRFGLGDFDVSSLQENSVFSEIRFDNHILYMNSDYQIKKDLDGNLLQIYVKTSPGRILLSLAFDQI
jgi:DNA-directed RNA polymerase subunit beta'